MARQIQILKPVEKPRVKVEIVRDISSKIVNVNKVRVD